METNSLDATRENTMPSGRSSPRDDPESEYIALVDAYSDFVNEVDAASERAA